MKQSLRKIAIEGKHIVKDFRIGTATTKVLKDISLQVAHGNYWHASTMRISVNHRFERRVELFPAGIDKDEILFCN